MLTEVKRSKKTHEKKHTVHTAGKLYNSYILERLLSAIGYIGTSESVLHPFCWSAACVPFHLLLVMLHGEYETVDERVNLALGLKSRMRVERGVHSGH